MSLSRRRLLQIAACAALAPGAARAETWEGIALGARARITLTGPASWRARAFAAIRAEVAQAEALFSLHDADSWLRRLNRSGTVPLPAKAAPLLALTDRLHAATQAQFDPTVQPLWQALARGGDVGAARRVLGWERVRHGGGSVTLGSGQALTFNGIAQGWATDRVADRLHGLGAREVLVQVGEMRAVGGPFRIGLPGDGAMSLQGRALATSEPGALRLGGGAHILSANGRAPIWSAVTVEAENAALADGLSTAAVFLTGGEIGAARRSLPGVGRIWTLSPSGDLTRL